MKIHRSSKRMLRRLTAAALSAILIVGMAQQLTAYAAEFGAQVVSEESQGQLATKTLDIIKYDPQWENASKVKKGNTHECSHLGFYIPAGVTFKIRQTNQNWKTDMTFRLRNDDNKTQEILTLKANGEWLEVTPNYDSVPTISSHYSASGEKPVVEYSIEGTKEIPVYQYGDNEAEFYAEWDELDAPFAIFQSTYTQWLVPARNKTSNTAGTLDDLLLYYDNMIRFYNEFSGLSTTTDEEWNRDSETRYFIKAGANGWGAAYYHVMETAPNSNSLESYMQNSGGWMPLHEVAHGYDTVNFDAVDIWNNVLSHYYQTRVLGKSVWLDPTEENRAKFEAEREEYGYWGDSQYSTKLYFWVNMLDKTGPQKTSAYAYQLYRKNVYEGKSNISGHSFYADAYTRGSGFNVTPWMELWGFDITDEVKLSLIEEECFENIYPLWNLVKSDETAKKIQSALGLESMYSMVETSELVSYNKNATDKVEGNLTVKLDDLTYSVIKGMNIRITDGKTLVETVEVTGKELTVKLPVGVYNIHVPGPASDKEVLLHNDMNYVVITEGETATHEVTATQIAETDEFVDWTITLGSTYTYQGTYFTATTDIAKEHIHLVTKSCNPHTSSNFNVSFSSFEILDENGNEVYSKLHPGTGTKAEDTIVSLKEGYTITVMHKEPQRGCKVYSSAVDSVMLVNNDTSAKEWKFKVTENGLARISPDPTSTGDENYYSVVCAYMDDLKENNDRLDFQTSGKLSNEKVKVTVAYAKLTTEQQTEFKTTYDGYYPFDQGVQELTIAPISEQSYTGTAVEPALSVEANGITLTTDQYRTEWFANTDVGTAKVKVYGLGEYKEFFGEATFAIVQPMTLSRDLEVKLEYSEVQFTGGYKYPEVEVKTNGKTLTRSVDYVIVYENNLDVGTATATAKGMGNYIGFTGTATFKITKRIQTFTVSVDPGKVNYTGEKIELPDAVTVWDVRNKLTEGKDYTLTYRDNTNVGTATVTATGIGNFDGCTGVGTFEITAPTTPKATDGTVFSNWKYSMDSYEWGGTGYLKLDVDVKNGFMQVQYNGAKTHSLIGDTIYASVAVFDTNESRSYYKEIIGNQNGAKTDEQVAIGLGYVVELYFMEPTRRNSTSYAESAESVSLTPKSARYLVTAKGLKEITSDGKASTTDPASQYDAVLRAYMDKLKNTYEKADFTDEEKLPTEKETVEAGLLLLTADQLAKFKEDYVGYYPFNIPKEIPSVIAPVANALTYNGEAQTLVLAGTTTAGTLEYKLGADGTYSTTLPTATNAGDYTVYYRVVGNKDVADVAEQPLSVTIQRATVTLTVNDKAIRVGDALPDLAAPVLGTDYTVSGLMGSDALNGTLQLEYRKNGQAVTPDTAKEGTYDIVVLGATEPVGGNYNALVVNNGHLTISPRSYSAPTYHIQNSSPVNGRVSLSTKYAREGHIVTISVKPNDGYELKTLSVLDQNGNAIALTDVGNGTYSFTMPDGMVTVNAIFEELQSEIPTMNFNDVTERDYFYDAVQWAAKSNITKGIGENRFGGGLSCTRAQMVMFLWNMAGCPESQDVDNPFSDLKSDSYYYKAVIWAMQNDITSGVSATQFAPEQTITRGQVVAFLHRFSGAASDDTNSGFTDVSDDAYYAAAVAWAEQQGITSGIGGGLFAPEDDCTRAQIVTLLYRAANR